MLISCPKCHSIYEIPDDLIPRTGQNFRCQACTNVWHAMRQDAIGYTEESEETPYIEAIPVTEPPARNYPANKKTFTIPADNKFGRKTRSSAEIIKTEGNPESVVVPKVKKKKEITLTSDMGTSFTISTDPVDESEELASPRFTNPEENTLSANKNDRLLPPKPFKGYKKTYALLAVLALTALLCFFRREIVVFYPAAETYYNKIALSGLNNAAHLQFKNINVSETKVEERPMLKITTDIYNDSFYTTYVPNITVNTIKETFSPARRLLKGNEYTEVEILLPLHENNQQTGLTLGFAKP